MSTAVTITSCSPTLIGQFPSSPITLTLTGTNFPSYETEPNPTLICSTSASTASPNPYILLKRIAGGTATSLICTYETQNTSVSIVTNKSYYIYYRGVSPNQNRVSTVTVLRFDVPTYSLSTPSPDLIDLTMSNVLINVSANDLKAQTAPTTPTSFLVINKNLPLDSNNKIPLVIGTYTNTELPVTYNPPMPLPSEGTYYITFDTGFGTVFSDPIVLSLPSATVIESITPTTILKQVGKTFDILLTGPAPTQPPSSAYLTEDKNSMMPVASLSVNAIMDDFTNLKCTLDTLPSTGGTYYITLIYPTGQVADNVVYSGTNFINVVTPIITSVTPPGSTPDEHPTTLTITLELDTPLVGQIPPVTRAFLTNDSYSKIASPNGDLTITNTSIDEPGRILTYKADTSRLLNNQSSYTYYVTFEYSGDNFVFADETNTSATFTQNPDTSPNVPFASMKITNVSPSTQPIKGGNIVLTLANIDSLIELFPPSVPPTLAYLIYDRYPLQTGGIPVPNGILTYFSGANTNILTFTLDPNVPSGSFYIVLEYGSGADPNENVVYAFSFDNTITIPPICFKENTKISCLKNNQEIDIFIQNLKKGDLVKTIKNGYLPVSVVGKSNCYNPKNLNRIKSRLYKLSKDKYPELTEDLVVTGCHSVLVDYISSDKKEQIESEMGKLYVTDNKYRMPAFLDERSDIYTEEYGDLDVYHVALGDDENINYGIYANGLLVESCFIPRVKNEMIVIS
jgi:hypothetical protein